MKSTGPYIRHSTEMPSIELSLKEKKKSKLRVKACGLNYRNYERQRRE